ncbi:MAG TPA: DUF6249 domain-containing protein [Acidobacteriaceae bacterium]
MPPELMIPLIMMSCPVVTVLITLYYRYQSTQSRYKMLLQLAEKNVPLPQELLIEPRLPYSERRRALVLIGGGLGLIAMFAALPFKLDSGQSLHGFWALGLLPVMTGLGYLVSWWLNRGDLRE